jgi:hypothetical protein
MMRVAAILFVALRGVSAQTALWGQCESTFPLKNKANATSRRWNWMDAGNHMCFWILLHLLESLVLSMSSVHRGWSKFDQLNDKTSKFDFYNFSKLNQSDVDNYNVNVNSATIRELYQSGHL